MGYLRHNSSIVEKYYNQDSVMSLSGTLYERKYSEVLISLQPLAVLPFQLSIEFIASRISLQGSETTSIGKDSSPKKDNSSSEHCMNDSFSKEKAIIGVAASKAWDWLKNGAAAKSPSDEIPSPPVLMGNVMISSITGILGKLSGTLKSDDKKCIQTEKEIVETAKTNDVERPIMATGLVNNLQTESPPAKPPRTSLKLELTKDESTVEAAAADITETGNQDRRLSGDNSVQSLPSDSTAMMSSFSGIAGKLLGINTDMPKKRDPTKPLPVKKEKSDSNDVDLEKTKSGLIRLFDKLLLPRDSSKKEQKLKSRWSWGYGQGQQVKPLTIATKTVPEKSELKSPGQSTQSKLPAYTGKGSNSQTKSATAAAPSKLVPRTTKLSRSSMKNSDNSLKMSNNSLEKQKESSGKTVREKTVMKSKVPVRKSASQKPVKEKSKPVEQKSDKVPKENKWQGAITLSASLEEGPTLKAPPSVTQMVAKFENKIDRISVEKDEENGEQEVPQGNSDSIVKETYKDAVTSDSTENTLHLSDEINCNSPNVATILELDAENHLKTADLGFKKPNFRYVQSTKDSDQSGGDFSYHAGDHFEVLAQLDSDWLYCINGKKEGLIRQEHVRPITDEEELKKLHGEFYS